MKTLGLFLAACALLLGVAGWYGWEQYRNFLSTPLDIPEGGTVFELDSGATGAGIVQQLAGLGLTSPGWKWRLLMRLEPHLYQAGEYLLEPGWGPQSVLNKLSSGEVVQYRFTLVEGWTYRQLLAELAENDVLKHEMAPDAEDGPPVTGEAPGSEHPEGWFLPETYQFTRGDSDRDIRYLVTQPNGHLVCICPDFWLVAILGFASRHLTRPRPFLAYANEAVLPFYVLHQTVIVFCAFLMIDWSIGIPFKFTVLVLVSFLVISTCYHFAIRPWWPVRRIGS